jgi:hypothetical protein
LPAAWNWRRFLVKKLGRSRCQDKPDPRCRIGDETPQPDDDSDVGEHLATFSREHHHVLTDDANFYVYRRVPRRRATTDTPSRLELLSRRLKEMNTRNRDFWADRIRQGKVAADGGGW